MPDNSHSVKQLSVQNLSVRFPTVRGTVCAVNGVSFELSQGASLGIVGESGSGKSVTARTLMNLLPRSAEVSGGVEFEGADVRRLARERVKHFWGVKMAMIFQDSMTSLNPVKKCGTQISETLRYHLKRDRKTARHEGIDLLNLVGIPEPKKRFDQYPHELSGGLRQRVVIAMALACDPSLLIADEPTTAVDVTVQKHLLDLLDRLRKERGMSLILITHDLGVARRRCDEIAVMYAGRIVERGKPEDLFEDPRHPYTDALLRSMPRLNTPIHSRLEAIGGPPPELINPTEQCSFAPRCTLAQADCLQSVPQLSGVIGMREIACFYPANTKRGRRALAKNRARGKTAAGLQMSARRHTSG